MSKAQREHYSIEENRRAMSKLTSKKVYPNIVSPDGVVYSTEWLTEFCREHNLEYSGVRKLLSGSSSAGHYKGWYVEGKKPDVIRLAGQKQTADWVAERTSKNKKTVLLKDPNGVIHKITGVTEFAKKNKLTFWLVSAVINGHRKEYKGWTLVDEDELVTD